MRRRAVAWTLGVVAALAIAGMAVVQVVHKREQEAKSKKVETPLVFEPREVARPTMAVMPLVVEFSGPLVAPQTAMVRAKSAGVLLALDVAEGQKVKAGQAVGRIDSSDVDNRLAERQAMLEAARVQVAQAQRNHDSNQRLAKEQFISANALEASRVTLDAARANARAAEAQLGTVRAAARLATLVAPIDGVVAKRHAVPGEKLSPEQQLLTLVDLRRLELAGSVGTHEVSLLKPGMTLDVTVEGSARSIRATLERIAPATEAGTRSIGVTVSIPNPDESFRAGQYALARATVADDTPRLTLPASAIVKSSGQDYVWLVEQGALARRAVTAGRGDAERGRVEILDGVAADSVVLAMKFDNLREGRKASVAAANATPAAAGAGATPGPSAAASSAMPK
jgi:membrane fusion protein (multidrug efflux system)